MNDRKLDDVQKEYTQACAELGNLKYQSRVASYDYSKFQDQQDKKMETVIMKMKKLNNEAFELTKNQQVEVQSESQS